MLCVGNREGDTLKGTPVEIDEMNRKTENAYPIIRAVCAQTEISLLTCPDHTHARPGSPIPRRMVLGSDGNRCQQGTVRVRSYGTLSHARAYTTLDPTSTGPQHKAKVASYPIPPLPSQKPLYSSPR